MIKKLQVGVMAKVNRPIFLVLNVLCSSNGQELGTGFFFSVFSVSFV